MNTLEDYRQWLLTQNYTPSTIDASLKVLRRLNLKEPKPTRSDAFLLRRYLRYVKETKHNPLGKAFTEALSGLGVVPATPRAVSGARKRTLISMKDFHRLKERYIGSDDRSAVLVGHYMVSGMKPHEFLELRVAKSSVSSLFGVKQIPTYELLSKSKTWAYRMMLAAAKREAAALDIDADLDILYRSRLAML